MNRLILRSFLFVLVLFLAGFALFLYKIPSISTKSQEETDAIIVLTGGLNRINTGFKILNSDKSQKLFISGVYNDTKLKELFVLHDNEIKSLLLGNKKIEIGKEATSTRENAIETYKWIKKNNIKTIRLVTSNYHMPRSIFEFNKLLPNVKIIPHPVFTVNFQKNNIIKHKMTLKLALKEYVKFIYISGEYYINKLKHVIF